jgi:ribosomal protein S6
METIEEKYKRIRPLIKDGDLILFHGRSLLAYIIQKSDKAYYNHVGVVVEKLGALYIVDSNAKGVQADRLSWRIKKYKRGDFIAIQSERIEAQIKYELGKLLHKSDDTWIKYDYLNGVKELLNRAFGLSLRITKRDEHDICSDYVSEYAVNLHLVKKGFTELNIQFPQDYIRYRNLDNTKIIN